MKTCLAMTALLALSSGSASAEVTTTGEARMGVIDDFGATDPVFTSRVRIIFTGSGESDSGFFFGASIRNDNGADGALGTAGSVYISGPIGKLSMGDVDSAALAAIGHVDGVGLTGLGDLNESLFIATGGGNGEFEDYPFFYVEDLEITGDPSILYEYSSGNLMLAASATQRAYSYDDGLNIWGGEALAVGAAYALGGYRVAAGYERMTDVAPGFNSNVTDNLVLGVDASLGPVTVKARLGQGASDYADTAGDFQDNDQWALSATYAANALALTAFASNLHYTASLDGENFYRRKVIGLGVAYDLGGGATMKSGILRRTETEFDSPAVRDTALDFGLNLSF